MEKNDPSWPASPHKNSGAGWGDVAPWYDDLLETGSTYQKDVILPDLLGILNIKEGDKILDLACGQGFFSRAFRSVGAKVIGVDISHELIDIAKNYEKASPGTKFDANPPYVREQENLVPGLADDAEEGTKSARSLTQGLPALREQAGGFPPVPNGYVRAGAADIAPSSAINYFVAPSHKLDFIPSGSMDKVALVLALQNIEKANETFMECTRVIKAGGSLVFVLNHPAFRVPKESSWGFDEKSETQYRRVDKYMSEFKVSINMHPGEKDPKFTASFHRPLQFYFKALKSAGFMVRTVHELISNKVSAPGKRAQAENQARKEIPLFMVIEAIKS